MSARAQHRRSVKAWGRAWLTGLAILAGCNNDLSVSTIERELSVSPALLDLGTISVGETAKDFIQLDSLSGGTISIRDVDVLNVEGEYFSYGGEMQFSVTQGESTFLEFVYTPTVPGFHRATITLVSDAQESQITVDIRGQAEEPSAAVYPLAIDFGPVALDDYGSSEVNVINHGELPIEVTDATFTNPVFELSIPLPIEVPVGQTRVVPLIFTPVSEQPVSGELILMLGEVPLNGVVLRGNDCENGDPNLYDVDGDGTTACSGDCEEDNADIGPGAPELPDGIDNDCDSIVDEGTSRYDDDGDGYCEDETDCEGTAEPGDCNDDDDAVNPDAAEVPDNGQDDDCDGTVDDGTLDLDGDGYTADGGDCDESDPTTHPGAPELPDQLDNDCDGTVDEGTVRYDDDGDGYCESPSSCEGTAEPGDCNDTSDEIAPGADELADFIDNDCDGTVDEGTDNADDDGDGFAENGGDCDDTDPTLSPGLGTC